MRLGRELGGPLFKVSDMLGVVPHASRDIRSRSRWGQPAYYVKFTSLIHRAGVGFSGKLYVLRTVLGFQVRTVIMQLRRIAGIKPLGVSTAAPHFHRELIPQ